MKIYRIAVIPGDGIGVEVMPEGVKVLKAVAEVLGCFRFEFSSFPWGCKYYLSHGKMMPDDSLKLLEAFDAIYFGAVGYPGVPDSISIKLRLSICQGFDQYANIRPTILLPGICSPLHNKKTEDIDFIVVRENTEGEYTGAGGRSHKGFPQETAIQTAVFTRSGIERVVRYAFQLAQKRPRKRLASVSKSNAMEFVFGLWDEVFQDIAQEYPEVSVERVLVDAMAARFVLQPESLDVVVASNLFADILTDLGAAIAGSLGMEPTGNLNPERNFPSMFEPIHGSAPDISGKNIANPIGMIWSGALMLEFLGEVQAADLVLSAIKAVTTRGHPLTRDIGGSASTVEVGEAIVAQLHAFSGSIQ